MKLVHQLVGTPTAEERGTDLAWPGTYWFNGSTYQIAPQFSYETSKVSAPDAAFKSRVDVIHRQHGVIAAAVEARALLLSELRFMWRNMVPAANGKLFGNAELGMLENPNEWQTRSEFLKVLEYHASYDGNAYVHRDGNNLRILNPQWVSIVLGSDLDPRTAIHQRDLRVVQYLYQPGGSPQYGKPEILDRSTVAHWRPEPDPTAWWRGQSWVQSILAEWAVDVSARTHTQAFFEHGATPNVVIGLDSSVSQDVVKEYAQMVADGHAGAANAYKTLVLGGGADVKVVGSDLARLDLKQVQGAAETRIALRSRVPAVVLQIGEGMQGSSLNTGNYQSARRMWSDGWFSPTAGNLCSAMESVLTVPAAAELWFDPSRVMFLQDDRLDEANIQQAQAGTLRSLIDGGFEAASAVEAVNTGDFTKLKHSGLYSVQLQPANSAPAAAPTPRFDVNVAAPRMSVTTGETRVQMPDVHVDTPAVTVEAPNVTIEPPVVNVAPAEVTVERSDVVVNMPDPVTVTKTVNRDANGQIETITEERS